MKRILFFLLLFSYSPTCYSQSIVMNGTYQGKNLYIQNPYTGQSKDFCTQKVLVNGKEIVFENADAYEIKMDSMGFKIGDTVRVEIFHKADCLPKILGDCIDCGMKPTFDLVSISIDSNAVLHWTSKNEIGKLPFVIEQFRWNKWIKIGEVDGKGGAQQNEYSFQTIPHSGKNQFRIKQVDHSGMPRLSKAVYFTGPELKIKIMGDQYKLSDKLEFNKETMYELYDQHGNIVKRGTGQEINLKKLNEGTYYLNYDNKMTEINKFW